MGRIGGEGAVGEVAGAMSTAVRAAEHRFTLPLFLTKQNKLLCGAIWTVSAAVLYLSTNHFHLFEPQMLPMSPIDKIVPFIPHTVWIYNTEYLLFFSVYGICKDLVNLNKYLYSFLALQIVSALIFLLWPTTFPRENFPLPETLDHATYTIFSMLRQTDSPASCAPSLHVSSVYLSSFVFLDEKRELFWPYFFWATAIGISTLTTKQHYMIDVITGLMMAMACYWVFHRWVGYRAPRK